MNTNSETYSRELFREYLENRDNLTIVHPILPKGWELDKYGLGLLKGNVSRGCLIIKRISPPYAIFELYLRTRYHVDCFVGTKQVCVIDYDNSIVYEIGKVEDICSEECKRLIQQGKKWLDENYPDWQDPTKYWED